MSRRTTRRCVTVAGDSDIDQLQADGEITVEDADALRDFMAFLRGEISAAELDERSRR